MRNEILVGTRKCKKDDVVNEELIYVWRGRIHLEKPRFTEVTSYYINDETGEVFAILKKVNWIPHILLMIGIMFLGFKIEAQVEQIQVVKYDNVINVRNDLISVNISNPESNTFDASFYIEYGGKNITEIITLKPGEDIGNVTLVQDSTLNPGSYMCNLVYSAKLGQLVMAETIYDVVLVVD